MGTIIRNGIEYGGVSAVDSLNDLTDVAISNPQQGDLLMYNSTGSKLENSVNVSSFLRGTLTVTPQGPTQTPQSILSANSTGTSLLAVSQCRNIQASTTDLTAGSSALATGDIYIVYE